VFVLLGVCGGQLRRGGGGGEVARRGTAGGSFGSRGHVDEGEQRLFSSEEGGGGRVRFQSSSPLTGGERTSRCWA
jgi:hypothetical protein